MILLCAATMREMEACLASIHFHFETFPEGSPKPWVRTQGKFVFAITGVGIPMTIAKLLPLASMLKPDLIVNIGIAGAYAESGLKIGDLVAGRSEVFGDMGMEAHGKEAFLPLGEFPWADEQYRHPMPLTVEPFDLQTRPDTEGTVRIYSGKGCTVNACTGQAATGLRRHLQTGADFESMEGAAVALVGAELGIPVCEVRAISNIAADRDMRPENITTALGNLGGYMGTWLKARI